MFMDHHMPAYNSIVVKLPRQEKSDLVLFNSSKLLTKSCVHPGKAYSNV